VKTEEEITAMEKELANLRMWNADLAAQLEKAGLPDIMALKKGAVDLCKANDKLREENGELRFKVSQQGRTVERLTQRGNVMSEFILRIRFNKKVAEAVRETLIEMPVPK
jgi:hypothetical protein